MPTMDTVLETSAAHAATAFDLVTFYFDAGGFVMVPLAAASVLLWFAIGYRISALPRPGKRSVRDMIKESVRGDGRRPRGLVERAALKALAISRRRPRHLRQRLDDAFADVEAELKKYSRFIVALVGAAPLLGLLGTVDGMIETFDSLAEMALFSQSGGIAGGISQALFTTQLGLAVAIPGLIVNGMIERRARELRRELAQVKDLLCGAGPQLVRNT